LSKEAQIVAEYIDKQAFLDYMRGTNRYFTVRCDIESFPTVDVVPVVHGRWEHIGGDEWCCSVCGFVLTTEGSWDKPTKKYCENCGTKMDERIK
jgi:hypothetical protein